MSSSKKSPTLHSDPAGNASIAMIAKAFYLVTRLCIPPLVLSYISLSEYGLWTACFILIMYVGLTDVGFSSVYVRFTARYHAEDNIDGINRLLSTGVTMLTCMALVIILVVWALLPSILEFLKIDVLYREKAGILILGTMSMFLLDLTLGAYCYLLHGLQRIKEEQSVAIVGYILEPTLIFICLYLGFGVYSLLIAFVLRYVMSLLSFMYLAHHFLPGLKVRFRYFDKKMLRHFYGFGAIVQASAFCATVLFSLDRILSGYFLGPSGMALFDLSTKLPVSALAIPSAISNVTMATGSRHAAQEDMEAIRSLYRQSTRSTGLIAAIPLGFIAAFSAPIGMAWLGTKMGELNGLTLIMTLTALWSYLHIITGPGSSILRAMGKVENEFVYHGLRVAMLLIWVSAMLFLMPTNLEGLAWGLAIGSAMASSMYILVNQRILHVPMRYLLHDAIIPGLFAFLLGGLFRLLWELSIPSTLGRWSTLAILGVVGMLYTFTYLLVCWSYILTPAERVSLKDLRGKFLGKLFWRQTR